MYFSPRERGPDRELWPHATTAAAADAAAAATTAPPQQELGRVRGRLRNRRGRHGLPPFVFVARPATAERQGKDHHGALTSKRKSI